MHAVLDVALQLKTQEVHFVCKMWRKLSWSAPCKKSSDCLERLMLASTILHDAKWDP